MNRVESWPHHFPFVRFDGHEGHDFGYIVGIVRGNDLVKVLRTKVFDEEDDIEISADDFLFAVRPLSRINTVLEEDAPDLDNDVVVEYVRSAAWSFRGPVVKDWDDETTLKDCEREVAAGWAAVRAAQRRQARP